MTKEQEQDHLLSECSYESDRSLEPVTTHDHKSRRSAAFGLFVKGGCFVFILIAVSVGSFLAGTRSSIPGSFLNSQCAEHTSAWSPVLDDVSIQYTPIMFNGSFMRENIYRHEAGPEVDAAWQDLGIHYRVAVISYEDGIASGLRPHFVQRAKKHGGGFLVNVEGMHHLHCLNLLRKSLYFNYDYYKKLGEMEFKNDEPILRPHITHCLDTIRQVLMCNVDTGMLGQVWVKGNQLGFPDFNSKHTCKNYAAVKEWARKNQILPDEDLPSDYLARPRQDDILPGIP